MVQIVFSTQVSLERCLKVTRCQSSTPKRTQLSDVNHRRRETANPRKENHQPSRTRILDQSSSSTVHSLLLTCLVDQRRSMAQCQKSATFSCTEKVYLSSCIRIKSCKSKILFSLESLHHVVSRITQDLQQ